MGFVGFVLFSEIALLLPQPSPFLAVKMCRLSLSIVLMVIFYTVWNSPLSLHPFFFCCRLFLNTNCSAGQKLLFHTWASLCGMLYPELTIICHCCGCNGVSGEFYRDRILSCFW